MITSSSGNHFDLLVFRYYWDLSCFMKHYLSITTSVQNVIFRLKSDLSFFMKPGPVDFIIFYTSIGSSITFLNSKPFRGSNIVRIFHLNPTCGLDHTSTTNYLRAHYCH